VTTRSVCLMKKYLLANSACLALVIACSPSSSESGASSVTAVQACAESAHDYCGHLATCAPYFLSTYGDVAACVARVQSVCASLLEASGTGLTPSQLQNCAKANASASCDDIATIGYQFTACQVSGSLIDGTACGDNSQCASGYCKMDFSQVCGVCAERGAVGSSCTRSENCQANLGCVSPSNCAALARLGASCATTPCLGRLACIGGVCKEPLTKGATCDPNAAQCDLRLGLYCDSSTNSCAQYTLVSPGGDCSSSTGISICVPTNTCNSNSQCEAPIADGAACTSSEACSYPAQCVSGVCLRPEPTQCK
jgi:hypothetical protein